MAANLPGGGSVTVPGPRVPATKQINLDSAMSITIGSMDVQENK